MALTCYGFVQCQIRMPAKPQLYTRFCNIPLPRRFDLERHQGMSVLTFSGSRSTFQRKKSLFFSLESSPWPTKLWKWKMTNQGNLHSDHDTIFRAFTHEFCIYNAQILNACFMHCKHGKVVEFKSCLEKSLNLMLVLKNIILPGKVVEKQRN